MINSGTSVLIACSMIRKELEYLMEDNPFPGEIVWMDKGLHEKPDVLRLRLQNEIDKWDGKVDYILLVYGLCGNGTIGLISHISTLVIPNFDDCLRVLLSRGPGNSIIYNPRALLYTDEWMDREESILSDEGRYIAQYGEKKGLKILKLMFKNYKSIEFLETGLYDINACEEQLTPIADKLGLSFTRCKAGLAAYKKFLNGDWDEETLVIPPNHEISLDDFSNRARCEFL